MPLPTELIELIHTKLLLTYGSRWVNSQGDVPIDLYRGHWAHELDGLTYEQVCHGLRSLPRDHPPNVLQFKALCYPPAPVQKLLPAARQRMPAAVKVQLAQLVAKVRGNADPLAFARRLREREQSGERLTLIQREAWRRALRVNRKETEHG